MEGDSHASSQSVSLMFAICDAVVRYSEQHVGRMVQTAMSGSSSKHSDIGIRTLWMLCFLVFFYDLNALCVITDTYFYPRHQPKWYVISLPWSLIGQMLMSW